MVRDSNSQTQQQYVQFPHETDTDHISIRILELFSRLEECDPTDLPPLQETVDGDALETILEDSSSDRYLTVEFEYNNAIVSITNQGRISVQPLHR